MEYCKTCKWWIVHKTGTVGTCDRVDSHLQDPQTKFEIEATADDDSGLSAKLLTGPNFGCVLHSPK